MAQTVKNPPAMQEMWVRSLGQDDPLEKEMATYSSILAWKNPMDRGDWQLQSVGHDLSTEHSCKPRAIKYSEKLSVWSARSFATYSDSLGQK